MANGNAPYDMVLAPLIRLGARSLAIDIANSGVIITGLIPVTSQAPGNYSTTVQVERRRRRHRRTIERFLYFR